MSDKSDVDKAAEKRAKLAYRKLLTHLRAGYSLDCFEEMSPQDIERAFLDFPHVYKRAEVDKAIRAGAKYWQDIGVRLSTGDIQGSQATYSLIMKHRYGYKDRDTQEIKHAGTISIVDYSSADTRV